MWNSVIASLLSCLSARQYRLLAADAIRLWQRPATYCSRGIPAAVRHRRLGPPKVAGIARRRRGGARRSYVNATSKGPSNRVLLCSLVPGSIATRFSMPPSVMNLWSFAGEENRANVNAMTLQPFLNYNLPKGWYLTTSPLITANWEAVDDNRWTVPIGGGIGRIFKIGHQPINANLAAYCQPCCLLQCPDTRRHRR
jgi:hypothetical protein